jgi:hypothetical protein
VHGFCCVYCDACGKDELVAFSCKRRGICPSCGARRMAELAAHLVDRVFPDLPVRQWVLSLPHGVRLGFTKYEPNLENRVIRPEIKGVPYGTQYSKELRDVLVKNGTLNADYTPNEATAARLGWKLKDPEEVPMRERW